MSETDKPWPSTELTEEERANLRRTTCEDCGKVTWCRYQEGDEDEEDEEEEAEKKELTSSQKDVLSRITDALPEQTSRPKNSHTGPHSDQTHELFDCEWVCEDCFYEAFL